MFLKKVEFQLKKQIKNKYINIFLKEEENIFLSLM